jgi:nitrogenase molybdenum-iron protein alpha/beta subunit
MIELLTAAAAIAATGFGYTRSRRFVRERLRFVDAAHRRAAPWLAGTAAAVVAVPLVALVPLVGAGTALLFGAGVGTGVAHGSRDVQSGK